MTKKRKILVWSIIIFLLTGIFTVWFLFKGNLIAMGGFVAGLSAPEEQSQTYKENKEKFKKTKKKAKLSYLNTKNDPVKTPPDAINSEAYQQAWGYIDDIDKIAGRLKFLQSMYDILGSSNPDAVVDVAPFFMGDIYDKFMALPQEANYALMEAMYGNNVEWETKYWLSHILGNREVKEALPIFRGIASDENEMFLLRIVSLDQIGNLKDKEANNLMLELLDNPDRGIRDKASSIIQDTSAQGDEYTYEKVLNHYYNEEDKEVKGGLLTAIIIVGGEKSLPEVREILKTADSDERERIAIVLETVHTRGSFEILRDLYNPQDENASSVINSLARLELDEANQFLYGIIEQADGLNSVMAASYLVEDHNQKGAVPYIEKALEKETKGEFIRDYEDFLNKLAQ